MQVGPELMKAFAINIIQHYNVEENISKINIPCLILHGGKDQRINVHNAKYLHENIPCSFLKIFKQNSHGINKEIPEKVAKLLISFPKKK